MAGLWNTSDFEKMIFDKKAAQLNIKTYDLGLNYTGNIEKYK